jgi:hypothetical protein
MINAQEIQYPDGSKVDKLNLVSNNITLSQMDPVDWDSLFDEDDNPKPEFDFHIMDCLFTLTPLLILIDESGNKHDMASLKIGEKIKYMGDSFEIYDTEKMSGVFEYILEKSGEIRTELNTNGIN